MTTYVGPDGRARCAWAGAAPEFLGYHDTEWGFPVADDRHLFEKICLESFQSGLSWRTILSKRENFRHAFAGFDCRVVARFAEAEVARLLGDSGIVRHRGKIEAAINNARRAIELIDEGRSLAAYFWSYEPAAGQSTPQSTGTSSAPHALAKDLKARGWSFVGPTTVLAFMQAAGLVNDHADDCAIRPLARAQRAGFSPPR
jgi:DNA-3-methyladenine glycosylase I